MKISVLSQAEGHLDEGYEWYERQDPGAGDYFLRSMYVELESLHKLAGIHRRRFGRHCLKAGKFPFGIFYTIRGDTVEVCAVIDLRRRPAWIRRELGRR